MSIYKFVGSVLGSDNGSYLIFSEQENQIQNLSQMAYLLILTLVLKFS